MDEAWRKLAEPFPPGEVQWRIEALSKDRKRALVVPYVDARTVLDRLDRAVGPEGWQDSYEVLADEERTLRDERGERRERLCEVKCRLTVLGVTKEDVGEGDSLKAAFSDALKRAAVKFGVGRYLYRLEKQWVDYDPEKGRFTPPRLPEAATPEEAEEEEKPEAYRLIDQLLERLKEKGLGREAARIVTKYGGYGKTPEETKRLYGELRSLLKG
ncbi:MAG: Rad52/Rad22 family DNA repair protein [Thermus sp.]|uniref:Rad52/Rad22 family DNA repair protein n=1 Tax=unclassified Thermus TaxID=2619321 RepID=UPI000238968A|nr:MULTISPECIES: Rad52/Rad22 family DNA repair protein [unclassified Thermus]AEV15807.1 Rad52/22 double-strand break repair protein [Thermus sp. CCB_US3_UF1]MCS6867458.1 Rad52/Rad22 family DNA repair protein [Thermus sp.]MCS7218882.1 Rad52/Rad22 family DNA repair protein [Thermus sp.]MCX7849783.1 Rad52/Rad22 family DNA repair protein [Thermus sp.]MDW8016401.1 Rad52/Rad22 family DNA repair protein [Thermus sp.]